MSCDFFAAGSVFKDRCVKLGSSWVSKIFLYFLFIILDWLAYELVPRC